MRGPSGGQIELVALATIAAVAIIADRHHAAPVPSGCGCQLCACNGQVTAYATGTCQAGYHCEACTAAGGDLYPCAVAD